MKRPRLGQHFLTRPELAAMVADAAPLTPESTVLEVGPGHGILTRELLARAGKVVALEKDPALVAELKMQFATEIAEERLALLSLDVRDFAPETCEFLKGGYVVVANIPYYVTGNLIRGLLTATLQPTHMALLIQKEVAERIVAADGKESLLSLSVKAYGTPRYVRTVKRGSFSPPPKVDSAILAIGNISRKHFHTAGDEERFFTLLHAGFGSKRKQLGKLLAPHTSDAAHERCDVSKNTRAEDVPLECWLCLAKAFRSARSR